jgi:hypothetical protein
MPTLADGNLPFRVGLLYHLAGDQWCAGGECPDERHNPGRSRQEKTWHEQTARSPATYLPHYRGGCDILWSGQSFGPVNPGGGANGLHDSPAASVGICLADPNASANVGRLFRIVDDESQLPAGTSAVSADVTAAQAFADLYTACQNAGDLGQITALYTEAMFQDSLAARIPVRLLPENPLQALLTFLLDSTARDRAEAAAYLAEDLAATLPLSPPIANAEVRDVRVLPDGRLGAVLVQDLRPTEFQIYARGRPASSR